jgi:hypothetical protein
MYGKNQMCVTPPSRRKIKRTRKLRAAATNALQRREFELSMFMTNTLWETIC